MVDCACKCENGPQGVNLSHCVGGSEVSTLSSDLHHLLESIRPTAVDREKRQRALQDFHKIILELWPHYSLTVCGSVSTNTFLRHSDVDVVIHCEEPYRVAMYKVSQHISPRHWKCVVLSNARVPIIKLTHKRTQVAIDVAINRDSGLRTTEFVSQQLKQLPLLKPLLLIFKHLLYKFDLADPFYGGMSSYVLAVLLSSYLRKLDSPRISLTDAFLGFLREHSLSLPTRKKSFLELVDPQDSENDLGRTVFNYLEILLLFDSLLVFLSKTSSPAPLTKFISCREKKSKRVAPPPMQPKSLNRRRGKLQLR